MKTNTTTPKQLIEQFLSGKISANDEKCLLDWIDQDPDNLSFFNNEQARLRPIILSRRERITNKHWSILQKTIHIKPPIRLFNTKKRKQLIGILSIAATMLVGLVIYTLISNIQTPTREQLLVYTHLSTSLGEKTSLTLPDGTRVNLNAGSSLRYPNSFSENERKVELSGEAFFDVVPNKNKPFIVQTQVLNVRVMGTRFNIEAFSNASEVNTTLVEGKVILEKIINNKMVSLVSMKPNERAVYQINDQKINISTEKEINQYIAWKDGKLIFLNDPIEEVAKKLGLWYNVSVVIQSDELKKSHFTGTFTNETIEKVLTLLSVSSPIDYRITEVSDLKDGDDIQKRQIILTKRLSN